MKIHSLVTASMLFALALCQATPVRATEGETFMGQSLESRCAHMAINGRHEFKRVYVEAEIIYTNLAQAINEFLATLSASDRALISRKRGNTIDDLEQAASLDEILQGKISLVKRRLKNLNCRISYLDHDVMGRLHKNETASKCEIEARASYSMGVSISAFYKIRQSDDGPSNGDTSIFGPHITISIYGDGLADSKKLWQAYREEFGEYLYKRSHPGFFDPHFDFARSDHEMWAEMTNDPEIVGRARTESGFLSFVNNASSVWCPLYENPVSTSGTHRGPHRKFHRPNIFNTHSFKE